MKKNPFCSVIVLNYYGEKIIDGTLNSLLNQNFPKDRYEIIVVDNNSKDRSRDILYSYSQKYKQIKNIFLDRNLGFSKGNNIAIKKAKGEFVALINNDCMVEKNWLKEIVAPAASDNRVFAVSSKILLYPKFISVKFTTQSGFSPVYAWLSKSKLYENPDSPLIYLSIGKKPSAFAFSFEYYEIRIPYDPYKDDNVECSVLFNSQGSKIEKDTEFKNVISFTNKSVEILEIKYNEDDIECKISLKVSGSLFEKESVNKIQNAGIMVFQDGYGRDIGAIVRYNHQHYEFDQGQYNKKREVYAACGAAVLYSKKIFKKIGLLDERFFMYYEDLEISERARLLGYKIMYSPKAVVRHRHAVSSKEWSPFFVYHVEKGRLLHVFYNFPIKVFLMEYFGLIFNTFIQTLSIIVRIRSFVYSVRTKRTEEQEPKFARKVQTIRALSYFIINLPFLLFRRFNYMKKRDRKSVEENYSKILKGKWYFS